MPFVVVLRGEKCKSVADVFSVIDSKRNSGAAEKERTSGIDTATKMTVAGGGSNEDETLNLGICSSYSFHEITKRRVFRTLWAHLRRGALIIIIIFGFRRQWS